ncbi:hypothetical protein DFH08DRAFT_820330 [Mycena albidolilacea]|uniref:Uncharacterized protein n=1 Tax=Mycena albidolilacea TaxID=1033008 RepID=A0AAD6ZDJ1_9AGAR|nr:hypothetical protein DFH08DRAFT_820330 [Mycena albidolilacea]
MALGVVVVVGGTTASSVRGLFLHHRRLSVPPRVHKVRAHLRKAGGRRPWANESIRALSRQNEKAGTRNHRKRRWGRRKGERRREGGHGAHIDETQKGSRVRKNRSEARATGVHIGCVVGRSAGSKEGVSMRWTMSGVRKKAQGVRMTLRVITTRVETRGSAELAMSTILVHPDKEEKNSPAAKILGSHPAPLHARTAHTTGVADVAGVKAGAAVGRSLRMNATQRNLGFAGLGRTWGALRPSSSRIGRKPASRCTKCDACQVNVPFQAAIQSLSDSSECRSVSSTPCNLPRTGKTAGTVGTGNKVHDRSRLSLVFAIPACSPLLSQQEFTFWLAKRACAYAHGLVRTLGLDLDQSPSPADRLASRFVGLASPFARLAEKRARLSEQTGLRLLLATKALSN